VYFLLVMNTPKMPPPLYLDHTSRGHFPPVTRAKKRRGKKGRVPTPRPTGLLLQSQMQSKLVPDLAHTGIRTSLEEPELPPVLPNARLNPHFVKLATRRAHDVAFDKVRVERKKEIAPLMNFPHENHHDFMNKIMVDIMKERAEVAARNRELFEEGKKAAGFGDSFNSTMDMNTMPLPMAKKKDNGGLKVRPKKYFNTLSLFECLWASTEPRLSTKNPKYGATLPKYKESDDDVFATKTGTVVIPNEWDVGCVFDAHFGPEEESEDPFAQKKMSSSIVGLNRTISRDMIKTMSMERKSHFENPMSPLPGKIGNAMAKTM
jgi:hypothetical protein